MAFFVRNVRKLCASALFYCSIVLLLYETGHTTSTVSTAELIFLLLKRHSLRNFAPCKFLKIVERSYLGFSQQYRTRGCNSLFHQVLYSKIVQQESVCPCSKKYHVANALLTNEVLLKSLQLAYLITCICRGLKPLVRW